ncbi:MAG: Asp23/Gls24 family envelope stress response protein [Lachnospiraceae bacterium]
MEQEAEKSGYEIQGKAGTVKIADDVVAMIAALAATEVDGVAAMAGNLTNELLSRVGVRGLSRGAKVDVSGRKVKVELAITVEYGYNIPATCQRIQTKVKGAIENMTGLEVLDVNIRIAGINVTKEK